MMAKAKYSAEFEAWFRGWAERHESMPWSNSRLEELKGYMWDSWRAAKS